MARDSTEPGPAGIDPPRLWTVEEANARLPDLERLLGQLRGWSHRLGEVHAELHRMQEFWGKELDAPDHVDHERTAHLGAEWANLGRRLDEAIGSLRREAIEVKNLESGLVDFYGYVDGEVVFLCWLKGESDVAHFHTLTGGFRARRPLTAARVTVPPAAPRDRR